MESYSAIWGHNNHTVRIALYMFTHNIIVFTSKYLAFTDWLRDTYKFYVDTYVKSCCRINTLFTEYRETSLVWCLCLLATRLTNDVVSNVTVLPLVCCTTSLLATCF